MSVIKESSDELNPTIIASGETVEASRPRRGLTDYLALAIATCGVGYLPLAPGTWGSLLAVAAFAYAHDSLLGGSIDTAPIIDDNTFVVGLLAAIAIVTFVGIWAASRTERVLRLKDPGKVVVDEVAGQLIALAPLALTRLFPILILVAFILFRFFDIVKPYPARRLEKLRGGWGIMLDDLIAGIYAALIVGVLAVWLDWPIN